MTADRPQTRPPANRYFRLFLNVPKQRYDVKVFLPNRNNFGAHVFDVGHDMTDDSSGQVGANQDGETSSPRFQISEQQFERAFDVLCADESGHGFSLRDLLSAVILMVWAELPNSIASENALGLIDQFADAAN